jgi:DNA gyrase subunit B
MVGKTKSRGTTITFKPDDTIFEETEFSYDILSNRLRELAFLNSGVKITLIDERIDRQNEFFYKGGIIEFVEYINRNKKVLHKNPIFVTGSKEDCLVEVALQYNDTYAENIFSFANSINTTEGGTHLIGFRSALTRAFNNYAVSSNILKNGKESFKGEDLREGLACVISVKIRNPQFEADQDKTREQRGQGSSRECLRQDQQLSGGESLRRHSLGSVWMRPERAKRPGTPAN